MNRTARETRSGTDVERDSAGNGAPGVFRGYIDRFLERGVFELGLAEASLEAYGADLTRYAAFLEATGCREPAGVTRDHVLAHLIALRKEGLSARSAARHLSAIRRFHAFLRDEGLAAHDPAEGLDAPRLMRALPDVLGEAEMERILAQADPATRLGARDGAILELFYSCGLRISELAGLRGRDCSLEEGLARVRGKGGKTRVVPMGRRAMARLEAWLAVRGAGVVRSDAVFLSSRGGPLSRVRLWQIVKHYARKAGLSKNVKPHTFRHTFATHLLDHGADLRAVQELLGHADISTTQVYTHVSTDRLQRTHRKCHPRA